MSGLNYYPKHYSRHDLSTKRDGINFLVFRIILLMCSLVISFVCGRLSIHQWNHISIASGLFFVREQIVQHLLSYRKLKITHQFNNIFFLRIFSCLFIICLVSRIHLSLFLFHQLLLHYANKFLYLPYFKLPKYVADIFSKICGTFS